MTGQYKLIHGNTQDGNTTVHLAFEKDGRTFYAKPVEFFEMVDGAVPVKPWLTSSREDIDALLEVALKYWATNTMESQPVEDDFGEVVVVNVKDIYGPIWLERKKKTLRKETWELGFKDNCYTYNFNFRSRDKALEVIANLTLLREVHKKHG